MRTRLCVMIVLISVLLSACNAFPAANDPLSGTYWELTAYRKTSPIEGSKTTIRFENGQVSGLGGCNQYGGEYQIDGETLTITMLHMTEMACLSPEGIMEQEQLFLQYLGDAQRFVLSDGQLQIYWTDHEALTFAPIAQAKIPAQGNYGLPAAHPGRFDPDRQ